MSSPEERLAETYAAYKTADDNRIRDLRAAPTAEAADAVLENLDSLHAIYLRAAKVALDASGDQVEAAFEAARSANKQITKARQEAQELAAVIKLTAHAVNTMSQLVVAATG